MADHRAGSDRRAPSSLLDVRLDDAQRGAAHRPPGDAMLVLGEAGHGKTTVAVHRLAHLYATSRRRFRAAFLVPSEGLRRLVQPLLTALGADVPVMTYDAFALQQARRAFGDLPARASAGATAGVARIKRDPALRAILAELAARPPGVIDDDLDAPPPATEALAHRGDLQHLFGDRRLMERLARGSAQPIGAHAVEEVLEHTRVQFSARAEAAHAHVDAERLVTVDARLLDDGTPDEDAQTVDAEDVAVLFELDRLRARRARAKPTRPRPYDCIVVDEAQELAPLELVLVGRSLARGGTLVVAGDADQQVDEAACFGAWAATMLHLGVTTYETVLLEVGYRCPPAVVELARAVRDGRSVPRGTVTVHRARDAAAIAAWITAEAERIEAREPGASVCVVARAAHTARALSAALTGLVPRRLVLGGEFTPHDGVDVTSVDQVKGLEFDHVLVADASAAAYPDDAAARRALYVAVTRARRGVALACVGAPSPLVR